MLARVNAGFLPHFLHFMTGEPWPERQTRGSACRYHGNYPDFIPTAQNFIIGDVLA
jgi:hypothetical protein